MNLYTWTVSLVLCLVGNGVVGGDTSKIYRICVPRILKMDCEEMMHTLAEGGGRIECVFANDKIGCIDKVGKNEADFLPLEPEEIYVANKFQRFAFGVISEIRATEFKFRDFRYEPVAVIRNSAGINSISDLKGKRSCHTGFGRNAGWKVPFSHLLEKNEISKYCDEIDAPTVERDMYAISKYFGDACAPGKWVPEDEYDRALKQKYSQLCKLCKSSDCSDKDGDGYIGYGGALMCLTQNDGDVAWTKMDAVEKHFQLKDGTGIPISSQYSFLCWDGTSVPLTSENPCSWTRRPWPAFVASTRPSISIPDLQGQLSIASSNQSAKWRKTILEIDAASELYHYPEDYKRTHSPANYLEHANYSITIQKPSCPSKHIRICVESFVAQQKCTDLKMASTGRRITPMFDCILSDTTCLKTIKEDKADIMFSEPKYADKVSRDGMQTILSEVESVIFNTTQTGAFRYAVAIVRTNSSILNMGDLQGKKSCHGSISSVAGWNIALNVLRDNKLISGPDCALPTAMAHFFNKSCIPGALDKKIGWLPSSLCELCSTSKYGSSDSSTCSDNNEEYYFGNLGALTCLKDDVADVAFIDHVLLNTPEFAKKTGINPEHISLLCPKGGRQKITEFHHCNWGKIPTRKVIARSGENNAVGREDARLALIKASDIFRPGSKSEIVFKLFGPYFGNSDLLVQDTSVGLIDDRAKSSATDHQLVQEYDVCPTSSAKILVPRLRNYFYVFVVFFSLFYSSKY